jgi:FkbM family methyltransferase
MASLIKRFFRKVLTPILWDRTSAEYGSGHLIFSQFGEDAILPYIFDADFIGTYVEVGAFHPMNLSNTYRLYHKGWSGLAIEPNPKAIDLFSRFRPRDQFIQCAVGRESGTVEMSMFADAAFNCTSEQIDHVPERLRQDVKTVQVPIRPLSEIINSAGVKKVDFLSIDCEGNDMNVLLSNDWKLIKPTAICVEDHEEDWYHSEITAFLAKIGYELRHRIGFSSMFVLLSSHSEEPRTRDWKA